MAKKLTSIRFSEAATEKLAALTECYGSQTTAVEVAIDALYMREMENMKSWTDNYSIGDTIKTVNPRTGQVEEGTITSYALDNIKSRHSVPTGLMVRFGDAQPVEIDYEFLEKENTRISAKMRRARWAKIPMTNASPDVIIKVQ